MAEVKNGVKYEITAEDKATPVAQSAAKNVTKSTKEVGEAFQGEFNPMSAVMAGVSGSAEGLAQQMLGLASRIKGVHMTMMKFSVYAALIMACVKAVQVLVGAWRDSRVAADNMKLDRLEGSLEHLKKQQAEWNEQLDIARQKTQAIRDNIVAEIDATERLTNARRDYNKALELSLAKTDEEKAAIERKYARDAAAGKAEAEKNRIAADREKLKQDIASWNEQIRDYKDTNKYLEKNMRSASGTMANAQERMRDHTWYWHFGLEDDQQVHTRASDNYIASANEWKSNIRAMEELEQKINAAENALIRLADKEKAVDLEAKTAEINIDSAEADAAKAAAEAKKKAAAEAKAKEEEQKKADKRLADQKRTEMEKAAEAEAKAIKAAQLKANREVMAERKKNLSELTALESKAAARLAAAQSKVAEAWSWYRDKDKMAAQLKEEKAEEAAQKQFEKDFEDLKWRRDWRTAKDLSVDEEAVRRVALAREEETAAQKALAETAASTAKAAASLAEIEKVITQEG